MKKERKGGRRGQSGGDRPRGIGRQKQDQRLSQGSARTMFRERQEKRLRINDDLLWGIHPVVEALREEPERFSVIYLVKDRRGSGIDELLDLARARSVRVQFVEGLKLTGEGAGTTRHQGVVARLNEAPLLGLNELLTRMERLMSEGRKPRLIVCDSLQDPHNLGAIIRSALASGTDGVVVTRERSAPLGGTAAKASAGAISHVDIYQLTNLVDGLKRLKSIGFWVFGAVKERDAVSLYKTDLRVPACIVVGSEGKGIRPLVRRECDQHLYIPMQAELDSLNSSVAAAVILFEAMRQNLPG